MARDEEIAGLPSQVGHDYRHGTGHGVGAALAVHEMPPYVGQKWDPKRRFFCRCRSSRFPHLAARETKDKRDALKADGNGMLWLSRTTLGTGQKLEECHSTLTGKAWESKQTCFMFPVL